ncbi:unnamed protein product, partial [Rotaria sp. Silwood2]
NDDNHVYLIIQSINTENVNDEPIQTPTQLVDLYQKTLESATQGKISIKNTFSIPLFERLSQVLNVVALNDKDNHNIGPNFVKAGLVIDPSGNILNAEEEEEEQQHTNKDGTKEESRSKGHSENIDSEQN